MQQLVVLFLFLAIGLIVGVLLGLNGFSQPATASSVLGQSPRIKNLLWLFSGFIPILMADFKKAGIPDFPVTEAFIGYAIGALCGAVAAVSWMCHSIRRSVRHFNATHNFADLEPNAFWREYLTYGKARYEEMWKTETARAAEEGGRKKLDFDGHKLTAKCVLAALAYQGKPAAQRDEGAFIDVILDAAGNLVRAHGPASMTAGASYMGYVPAAAASSQLKESARFVNGMTSPIEGYLDLRRGGGRQLRDVVLPVFRDLDAVLPGAPEAFRNANQVVIMDLRDIKFRRSVTPAVRKEIENYFEEPYFAQIASITCLPILDATAVKGVLNIESSETDLLGKKNKSTELLLARLQVLVGLLSVV